MQKIAIEKRFAVFLQAQYGIDLGSRLVGQQALQELDVTRRDFHVDHEVRAAEAEQDGQMLGRQQNGIEIQAAVRIAQNRDGKRNFVAAIDDLAYGVGSLVAKEQ